jgi:hypothetical protein
MKSLSSVALILTINLCFLPSNTVKSQDLPIDFKVVATVGGMIPGSEVRALYIQPDGITSFSRYKSNDLASDPLDHQQFTLTSEQLKQIWQAIQDDLFFSLADKYIDTLFTDGTYASITVTADSITHTVWVQNMDVYEIKHIINIINSITLPQYNLPYVTKDPPIFEQIDVCDQIGHKSSIYCIKPSKENPVPIPLIKPKSTKNGSTSAHPGTYVVINKMSLQQAINSGHASLNHKAASYWGDNIAVKVYEIWGGEKSSTTNKVTVRIYIEFYGEGATVANVDRIENAIESAWNDPQFEVEVIHRQSYSETPPGTTGYHQIELDPNLETSYVTGLGEDFGLNYGVGGGAWSTTGSSLDETYAHEAGHLMGLDDFYDDYRKMPDGKWQRQSDGQIFKNAELAELICADHNMTAAQMFAWLNNPEHNRITNPLPDHENDLMGTLDGVPLQSDKDEIASNGGVEINIEPGDILVNKFSDEQNLGITRGEHVFLPPGEESKEILGLYGACIDLHKSAPDWYTPYDVAPNLADWSNFEAANYLHKLLIYIDEKDLYCGSNYESQLLIWRITDNYLNYDRSLDSILVNIGVNIGDKILDFPKISNSNPFLDTSIYIIPHQLYTIGLQTSPALIIYQPQIITIDAKILVLNLEDIVGDFNWKLKRPTGSASQLSNSTGNSVNISPDIRGVYKLFVEANITELSNLDAVLDDSINIIFADKNTETFESGNINSLPPFTWTTMDPGKWIISNNVAHTGTYSISSGSIPDYGKSEISLNMVTSENDSIYFAYKVSTEEEDDFLRFYIDELLISEWSGESDWSMANFPIQKGNHTLKWVYEKDRSLYEGYDRCWIDDIFIPNSTITHVEKDISMNDHKVIAYPNPVEQYLTLKYVVESEQIITISLYDISGKFIKLLNDEIKGPGIQTETYNLAEISSGLYIIKIQNNKNSMTSNVSFIKE